MADINGMFEAPSDSEILRQYNMLLQIVAQVVENSRGTRVWEVHPAALGFKFLFHIGSLVGLCQGTRIGFLDNSEAEFFDFPSGNVILRAALETFLLFHYLYAETPDEPASSVSEGDFRRKVWQLGQLMERRNMPAADPENQKKQRFEKLEIARLTDEIEQHDVFKGLNKGKQKKAKMGRCLLEDKWGTLAGTADISQVYFDNLYGYLCSYSHSGGLAVMQIQQSISKTEDQKMLLYGTLWQALCVMSEFVHAYVKLFPELDVIIKGLSKEYGEVLEKWKPDRQAMDQHFAAVRAGDPDTLSV